MKTVNESQAENKYFHQKCGENAPCTDTCTINTSTDMQNKNTSNLYIETNTLYITIFISTMIFNNITCDKLEMYKTLLYNNDLQSTVVFNIIYAKPIFVSVPMDEHNISPYYII